VRLPSPLRRRRDRAPASGELPLPPYELREIVGPTDPAEFDNPSGGLVYPDLGPDAHRRVFDFGCGCGRIARQLLQQDSPPERYVGVDLHRKLVAWCADNLEPHAESFQFHHHDVFNATFNPGRSKPPTAPFPVPDGEFTLVNAWSVFTHLVQSQVAHYLGECSRLLAPGGVLQASFFLFDKREFAMLGSAQQALYGDDRDPTAAAIFDRAWVLEQIRAAGLTLRAAKPPKLRGY
jgi:SAM-dependent methyltransferase